MMNVQLDLAALQRIVLDPRIQQSAEIASVITRYVGQQQQGTPYNNATRRGRTTRANANALQS
jgi:hypothetical protein